MTDTELIARQAKQLEVLRDKVEDLQGRIKKAMSIMVCIGGPLNDNKDKFSNEQLYTFVRIQQELE